MIQILQTHQAEVKDEKWRGLVHLLLTQEQPQSIAFEEDDDDPFVHWDLVDVMILAAERREDEQLYEALTHHKYQHVKVIMVGMEAIPFLFSDLDDQVDKDRYDGEACPLDVVLVVLKSIKLEPVLIALIVLEAKHTADLDVSQEHKRVYNVTIEDQNFHEQPVFDFFGVVVLQVVLGPLDQVELQVQNGTDVDEYLNTPHVFEKQLVFFACKLDVCEVGQHQKEVHASDAVQYKGNFILYVELFERRLSRIDGIISNQLLSLSAINEKARHHQSDVKYNMALCFS